MGYNVTSVTCLELNATMRAEDVLALVRKNSKTPSQPLWPEACFIEEMKIDALDASSNGYPDAPIQLPNFLWCGEWSGNSFENIETKIAPLIIGTVRAVVTWEGGDSHSGFTIRDGAYTKCEVVFELKEASK